MKVLSIFLTSMSLLGWMINSRSEPSLTTTSTKPWASRLDVSNDNTPDSLEWDDTMDTTWTTDGGTVTHWSKKSWFNEQ